jgi:hypothetical protein
MRNVKKSSALLVILLFCLPQMFAQRIIELEADYFSIVGFPVL